MDNITEWLVAELIVAADEANKANAKLRQIEKLIRKNINEGFPDEVYIRMDGDVFKVEVSPTEVKINQINII